MALRIATFNAENIIQRFDFSGYRNELVRDRALQMLAVENEAHFRQLEQARVVAHTDDKMQLTALAIADCRADILCLQEVESIEAIKAFEYGYLFKMVGEGYRHKYIAEGNDGRGIDVAVLTREETADGDPIEFVRLKSHAHLTYGELGIFDDTLEQVGEKPNEKVFRRDCLEIDFRIGGREVTIFVVHMKSMGPGARGHRRPAVDDADPAGGIAGGAQGHRTAFRRGPDQHKRFLICGDLNDYRERIIVDGVHRPSASSFPPAEKSAGFDPLVEDGFAINLVERRPLLDRWTLFHSRGPREQHLCQLDYILASPAMAKSNAGAVPDIIRNGQPFRTPFPPGQAVERYPRTGWDRPKSSDHCPVAVTLHLA